MEYAEMTQEEMRSEMGRILASLKKLSLPGDAEYIASTKPEAAPYLESCRTKFLAAIEDNKAIIFQLELGKYVSGWKKIWQYMAEEHCEGRSKKEIDYRFFRHMPEGTVLEFNSKELGKFVVYPRSPNPLPVNAGKWLTAYDIVKMQSAPIISKIMREFDAWIVHEESDEEQKKQQMIRAIKRCKERFSKKAVQARIDAKAKAVVDAKKKAKRKPKSKGRMWGSDE